MSMEVLLPDRATLLDLSKRISVMLPGGNKLNDGERFALAQIAAMHGLDPFNGEVWYIPERGPMIGIKGLRKKARQQVQGNFWVEFRELDEAERARYGIEPNALAFEARLFDSENIRTYCSMVEQMTKSGVPWETVREMIGDKPYTSGIGVLRQSERTKMERVQCAMKRAEADAIKRRFDVPLGIGVDVDADEDSSASTKSEVNVIDQEIDPDDVLAKNKRILGRDDTGL